MSRTQRQKRPSKLDGASCAGSSRSTVVSTPSTPDPEELPCGRLELSNGGVAQCVLCELPEELGGDTVLITCHHVLPCLSAVTGGRLVFSSRAAFSLSPEKFSSCRSCCGDEGVWNTEQHCSDNCPYRNDWTILTLEQRFASELHQLRHHLQFLSLSLAAFDHSALHSLLNQKLEDVHLYVFARLESGNISKTKIELKLPISQPAASSGGKSSLDVRTRWYKDASVLRYRRDPFRNVGPGCSGAPIFCYYEGPVDDSPSGLQQGFNLIGIHQASPSNESTDKTQYGMALNYLLNCSLKAKDGGYCSLDSVLSFVKCALEYRLCGSEAMDKLASHLVAYRSSDSEENLQLLEFGLQAALSRPFSDLNRKNLKSIFKLLNAMFIHFERHKQVSGAQESVVKQVESLCDQLKEFMKEQRSTKGDPSDEELVAEGFELWNNILQWNCSKELKSSVRILHKAENFSLLSGLRWNIRDNADIQFLFGEISRLFYLYEREKLEQEASRQLDEEKAKSLNLSKELEELKAEGRNGPERCGEEELIKDLQDELEKSKRELEEMQMRESCLLKEKAALSEQLDACTCGRSGAALRSASNPEMLHYRAAKDGRPGGEEEDIMVADVYHLLFNQPHLRRRIAEYFEKVNGATGGDWEQLMHHCGLLDSMKIEVLQTQPVEAILMSILKAWRRRCHASVETFCSLCEDIRQSQVVEVFREAAESSGRRLVERRRTYDVFDRLMEESPNEFSEGRDI